MSSENIEKIISSVNTHPESPKSTEMTSHASLVEPNKFDCSNPQNQASIGNNIEKSETIVIIKKSAKSHTKSKHHRPNESGEDNGDMNKLSRRFRTSFEQNQLEVLEKIFEKTHYPDAYLRDEIAQETGLDESKVQVRSELLFFVL